MKYSFLMPYYDRAGQLEKTLFSFVNFYSYRKESFEVIIIEDSKNVKDNKKHNDLLNTLKKFYSLLNIKHFLHKGPETVNPVRLFNIGAKASFGEYLIITNPECVHSVDILKGFDEEFDKNKEVYIVCSCESLDKENNHHRWYHHSEFKNTCYHFCSVLLKETYFKVGEFDEEFNGGYGFDDNAFRDNLIINNITFILRDDLKVNHLYHPKVRPSNYKELLKINKKLYETKYNKVKRR